MIRVEVGQDDGVETPHVEAAKAAIHRGRLGSGVDQDGALLPGAQHEGIALATSHATNCQGGGQAKGPPARGGRR